MKSWLLGMAVGAWCVVGLHHAREVALGDLFAAGLTILALVHVSWAEDIRRWFE